MLQGSDRRLIFVLEGKSDVRSLERFVDQDECTVIAGYGKAAILEAFYELEIANQDRCVALVDRDFSDLIDEHVPSNVILTELHDREADLLLRANLIDDFISAISVPQMMSDLLKDSGDSNLRSAIVRVAIIVGSVRLYSQLESLGLNLSKLPFGTLVKRPMRLDTHELMQMIVKKTSNCDLDPHRLVERLPTTTVEPRDRICSGHDLISIISVSSNWWSSQNVGKREINNYILATVRLDVLEKLLWYRELASWATAKGHKIWQELPSPVPKAN
ncbi:MAG: DUF4435 domain-containing protein [Acidimicrobiaceae bacterium]|nr:DUF4435 domain-containing protein [Acidimicrobiaceae bacterium]